MKCVLIAVAVLSGLFVDPTLVSAQNGQGTIKGQVTWDGAVPPPDKIDVNQDPKHCLKDGPLFKETFVINAKNKGVKNVFVWLAPPPGGQLPIPDSLKSVPDKAVVIDQPCCAFVPHALAIRQGQVIEIRNSAPVAHNIRWSGHPLKNPGGNVTLVPGGKMELKGVQALKADRLPITLNCDIHRWMNGYIRVFEHPYFAVTDADGKFEIKHAPAGDWKLMVWQEGIGWLGGAAGRDGQPITVNAGKETDLNLKLKAPAP